MLSMLAQELGFREKEMFKQITQISQITTSSVERETFVMSSAKQIFTIMTVMLAFVFMTLPVKALDGRYEQFEGLTEGSNEITVKVPRGTINVNVYKPSSFTADSPVWVVIHGARRNVGRHIGFDYYSVWAPLAEKYGALLILPEFTKDKWPTSWQFQTGNVRTPRLHKISQRNQGFAVVHKAFRKAVRLSGSNQRKFSIYGHGAGGQWVQRYVLHSGGRYIKRAVAANPGWYMLPDYEYRFPYGLKGNPIAKSTLRRAFATDMVLLLGQNDVSHSAPLRTNAVTIQRGRNRFDRGHFYFSRAKLDARKLRARFSWHLEEVPGAGHHNYEMADAAAEILSR